MSDDLISRKVFMEYLGLEDTEENSEENVGEIVTLEDFDKQATVFNKEKVIGELNEKADYARNRWLNSTKEGQTKYWEGKENGIREAIEIVEKGGIERRG